MYCIWADVARRHPDRIIDAIKQRALFWAQQRMFYSIYGIETNQFQKLFASKAGLDLLKAGVRLPIQEINSTHWKEARIDSLQPDLYNGYLLLFKEPHAETPEELELLFDQLWAYPRGDYVDGPDALEMARSIAAMSIAGRGHDPARMSSGGDRFATVGMSRGDPFS
jgi:predicted phage terminase large subunit-like protein